MKADILRDLPSHVPLVDISPQSLRIVVLTVHASYPTRNGFSPMSNYPGGVFQRTFARVRRDISGHTQVPKVD